MKRCGAAVELLRYFPLLQCTCSGMPPGKALPTIVAALSTFPDNGGRHQSRNYQR
jgi:hypothetical protein